MSLRVIFMGTPDFAVPCLEKLCAEHEVIAVITQPDKPRGRGQKLVPSPVKVCALAKGIEVLQPVKVKDAEFVEIIRGLQPDLMVVVAFGQILSQALLDIPRLGCINVHGSLLPRYRGAAPMQWCLINGEQKTGVTTMQMDAGLDTGDMLLKAELELTPEMNLEQVHDSLSLLGADLLLKTIDGLTAGEIVPQKQNDDESCYSPMINKALCRIDWTQSAETIHNKVRALDSWPGAFTELDGKVYKIWRTRALAEAATLEPGTVTGLTKNGFTVATGQGTLEVLELQAPNKKRMQAAAYLRGHSLPEQACFK